MQEECGAWLVACWEVSEPEDTLVGTAGGTCDDTGSVLLLLQVGEHTWAFVAVGRPVDCSQGRIGCLQSLEGSLSALSRPDLSTVKNDPGSHFQLNFVTVPAFSALGWDASL